LINTLSGRKGTKTGNRPGITKSNQWIKTRGVLELLDTPGILWPKFEDQSVGLNLAFTGAIKDEILDKETLALRLLERLILNFPSLVERRYGIEINDDTGLDVMSKIAKKRGCIVRGGEVDYTKVCGIILDEFRKGVIGNITLELPKE
jgi:ribosome biogenesis GTPase A